MIAAFSIVGSVCAAVRGADQNIALHKKYALVPEPNYHLCADKGDLTQLTDGRVLDVGKKILWTQKGCVGWHIRTDAEIVIDLKRTYPISSVVVFSGSNPNAGVYLPNILIAVSDDGTDFRVVHRIDNHKARHVSRAALRANNLRTRGRYVMVRLQRNYSTFVFTDEIVVSRGKHDPKKVRLPEETIERLHVDTRTELQKRLMNGLDRLALQVERSGRSIEKAKFIAPLRKQVAAAATTRKAKFRVMDSKIALGLRERVRSLQRDVAR